jgi:hypothetical protein
MPGVKRLVDTTARRLAVRVLPAELRRRIAMRFPGAPVTPATFGEAAAGLDAATFEQMYAAEDDPYGFAASEHEARKYAATLELCGEGPFERAFELGCSIGVFTAQLAPRCRSLLAADISEVAVERARERVADQLQVIVERRALPHELPGGEFDLVVASDLLYYWDVPTLEGAAAALGARLVPGGRFVACHSFDGGVRKAQTAEGAHDVLRRVLPLEHVETRTVEGHLFDVFARPS